jgi:hypothetical protein
LGCYVWAWCPILASCVSVFRMLGGGGLFVFNITVEGPRAPVVKPGCVTQALAWVRRDWGLLPSSGRTIIESDLLVLTVWRSSYPISIFGRHWCMGSRWSIRQVCSSGGDCRRSRRCWLGGPQEGENRIWGQTKQSNRMRTNKTIEFEVPNFAPFRQKSLGDCTWPLLPTTGLAHCWWGGGPPLGPRLPCVLTRICCSCNARGERDGRHRKHEIKKTPSIFRTTTVQPSQCILVLSDVARGLAYLQSVVKTFHLHVKSVYI